MKKQIQTKIEYLIYGYVPGEFMPVFEDGKLINRREYVAYKATRAFVRFSNAFDRLRAAMQH